MGKGGRTLIICDDKVRASTPDPRAQSVKVRQRMRRSWGEKAGALAP